MRQEKGGQLRRRDYTRQSHSPTDTDVDCAADACAVAPNKMVSIASEAGGLISSELSY